MLLLTIKKVFNALGNERPQILIQLEDRVLEGIIAISEGKPREEAMAVLYSQISALKMDLAKDDDALSWFDLSSDPFAIVSSPTLPEFPSTPLARYVPADLRFHLKDKFLGQCCLSMTGKLSKSNFIAGGLASPPETRVNSPIFAIGSASTSQKGNLSPLRYVDPKDLLCSKPSFAQDLERQDRDELMEPEGDAHSHLKPGVDISDKNHRVDVDSSKALPLLPLDISDNNRTVDAQSVQASPYLPNDSGSTVDIDSREPEKKLQENDPGESMDQSSDPGDDDSTTVGIQSRLQSPLLQEDDASMVGVKSKDPSSDTDGDGGAGQPMSEVESSDSLENGKLKDSVVAVGSKEPLSDSEKVDEEGRSAKGVGIAEPNPNNGMESEDMLLDFESLGIDAFEPRRSSRINSSKKDAPAKATPNFLVTHKSSRGKKKPPPGREDVLFQASLRSFLSNEIV